MRRRSHDSGRLLRRAGIVLACLLPVLLLVGILISDELYTRLRATPNQADESSRAGAGRTWSDAPPGPVASSAPEAPSVPAPALPSDPPAAPARAAAEVAVPLPPEIDEAVVPPPPAVAQAPTPPQRPDEPGGPSVAAAEPEPDRPAQDVAAAPEPSPVEREPARETAAMPPPAEPDVALSGPPPAEAAAVAPQVATVAVTLPPEIAEPVVPPPVTAPGPALAGLDAPREPDRASPEATGALAAILPPPLPSRPTPPAASPEPSRAAEPARPLDVVHPLPPVRPASLPRVRSASLPPGGEAPSGTVVDLPGSSGPPPATDAGLVAPDRARDVPLPPRRPALLGTPAEPPTTERGTSSPPAPTSPARSRLQRPTDGPASNPRASAILPPELRPLSPRTPRRAP